MNAFYQLISVHPVNDRTIVTIIRKSLESSVKKRRINGGEFSVYNKFAGVLNHSNRSFMYEKTAVFLQRYVTKTNQFS